MTSGAKTVRVNRRSRRETETGRRTTGLSSAPTHSFGSCRSCKRGRGWILLTSSCWVSLDWRSRLPTSEPSVFYQQIFHCSLQLPQTIRPGNLSNFLVIIQYTTLFMYILTESYFIINESGDFALAKSPLSPNPMLKEGLAHHKEWISDHQFKDLLSLVWYNVGCSCQLVFYSVHLKHLPAFTRLAFYNIYCLYRLTDEPTD